MTAESIVENGETITLTRPCAGYGQPGRPSALGLTWTGSGGSADLAAPSLSYDYDGHSRLVSITATDTTGQPIATSISRTSTTRSHAIYPQSGQSQYISHSLDAAGRVSTVGSTYPKREIGNLAKVMELTYLQGNECCFRLCFPSPAG